MSRNSYKIYTLGCKVNQYDSNVLARKLNASGFELVERGARIAIINTCAVTRTAIRKGRQIFNRARKENPKAKIILMGCFPKVYRDEAEKLGVDLIWKVGELDELISKLQILIPKQIQNSKFKILNDNKSKYFLKIQDGCEQFCSYCIIPYTRGKLKSRSEKEVIKEFKEIVKAGYKEIVLCGIHLGLYGQEGKREKDLVKLLKKLIKVKGLGRIRLSSIEVNEVSDELIKLIAKEDKICNHLHIPLQSGSDKILKLMNRPYNKKIYKEKIRKIRKLIPNIAITTDVIVGFPGETEKDFKETYDFTKEINFSRLHIFPFSVHEKTPAAKMKDQIDRGVSLKRAEKLRNLGKKLENDFEKKFRSEEVEVLVEQVKNGKCYGKAGEYIEVEFRNKNCRVGELIKLKAGEQKGKKSIAT